MYCLATNSHLKFVYWRYYQSLATNRSVFCPVSSDLFDVYVCGGAGKQTETLKDRNAMVADVVALKM